MLHRVPRAEGLLRPALAFRAVHSVIATAFLFAIGYVWWCALTGRRGSLLRFAIGALLSEGALVIVNRGDCPLRPLQKRVGDPVPLFELEAAVWKLPGGDFEYIEVTVTRLEYDSADRDPERRATPERSG